MIYITLILSYLGTISSGAMLSMLLLLVATYISAFLWLISNNIIYTGLLYILVYVGAIVVLIMFVVQLTNTSLVETENKIPLVLLLIQNTVLILCLTLLIFSAYTELISDLLINLSYLNLTGVTQNSNILLSSNLINTFYSNNLSLLAYSIFNEYAYVLIISIHAIILAIIGPIKLAISNQ